MKNKFLVMAFASVFAVAVHAIDDECATPLTEAQLADHWVACEGVAPNKDAAIDDALKRGVSMVYGQLMSAETKLNSHYAEGSVEGPEGRISAKEREKSLDSNMQTKTAGFVREFRVISVSPDRGDSVKVHVHARIVNPRSGVDAVILITRPEASVELKSSLIKVGPKKSISGREIASVVEGSLCRALSGSSHFKIRTLNDVNSAVVNNAMTEKLVGAGMVPSTELLQAGQMLTCDYILTTKLEDIKYTKKLGQDKATKKFGQIQQMKIVMTIQLTDVRTGTAAANETLTFDLDNASIKKLLAEDEESDLIRATLDGLVKPLRTWVKHYKK